MDDRPGDEADGEVAGDVAPDGAVDVVADGPPARLRLRRQERVEAVHPRRPLEQHEERQERDRHDGDHGRDDALRHGERGAGDAQHPGRPALLHCVAHAVRDLVLALEEPERPAPAGEVVHVARDGLDEVVDLFDQHGHEGGSERRDHQQRAQVGAGHREAAAADAVRHQPLDRRIQSHRQEDGDEDPGEDAPGDLQDLDQHDRRENHAEHRQHDARPEGDGALFHGARIGTAPDG